MSRRAVLVPTLALATTLACLAIPAPPAAAASNAAPPIPAELTINTIDGEPLSFGELRGRAVLLDFWATWCKPCRMASPYLRRLHKRLGDNEHFVLVGVSSDSDLEALRAYVEEEEADWTQVWDSHDEIGNAFGVRSLPTYLILDHEGRPVKALTGWSDRHPLALDAEIGRAVRKARRAARRAEN